MGRGKLIIISDTAVSQNEEMHWVGYEPVVKEIEYFLKYWDEVVWLAYRFPSNKTIYSNPLPPSIKVKPISPVGGSGVLSKIFIVANYLNLFIQVYKLIKSSNEIHVRAPSHPAICAMILAPFFKNKTFWFKYAGSWIDKAPFSYSFQRKILKKISKKNIFTTINGKWIYSNENVLAFENPCFCEEIYDATSIENIAKNDILSLIYVGTLSEFKGVHLVMKALEIIEFKGIEKFTIVGIGEFEKKLIQIADSSLFKNRFVFYGKQSKEDVFKLLKDSDLLIIASETEGFPKVISEAMVNYCVPISTRVSCIDQYITDDVGFIIDKRDEREIANVLLKAVSDNNLNVKKINARKLAYKFTYENYIQRLFTEIFT